MMNRNIFAIALVFALALSLSAVSFATSHAISGWCSASATAPSAARRISATR